VLPVAVGDMVTALDETGTFLQMIAAAAAMACTGP
jgi:hypothetical protein